MKLLSPIRVGALELKNRVVSTAHGAFTDFWRPSADGERYMAYQERRAQGGTGLLIMTAMHVHKTSQVLNHYLYEADDISRKYQQISTRVHRHGAKILQQLFHIGASEKSDVNADLLPLWGWSGLPTASGEPTHAMTDSEVEEIIEAFVTTATIAVENGIDGVELHGTHGYLIQQSFSPYANRRTDKWGEPLYFLKELARRVRVAIGSDKVMGLRISADDFIRPEDGGVGFDGACRIAAEAIGTRLFDYLNHSEGTGGASYARSIGTYRHPFGEWLPLTRGLKHAMESAVPMIGVGKIATPDLAERALESEDCDLVGMTRAQIADPDLVKKLMERQGNRIRTCTGSNQGCFDRSRLGITCFQNPEVGEEVRFRLAAAREFTKKRILVIGGGPAGMKAAEVAAKRGHEVILTEAGDRLGGRLNIVETLGDPSNLLAATSWIEAELGRLPVTIETQLRVDAQIARDFKPDAIILATGALSTAELSVPNDGSIPVISGDEATLGLFNGEKIDMDGTKALMIDIRANYETALVTEAIARKRSRVTAITPHLHWGFNVGPSHRTEYLKLLPQLGVDLVPLTALVRVSEGRAVVRNLSTEQEHALECDFIVAGSMPAPQDSLFGALSELAPCTNVGDSLAPRSAMEAIREGDRIGRVI